ncbi:MAG: SDR family oxidoreductase [Chthoniobacterales bacterium]|nr:SDR family oxidoreductase [Chthoniobacterales bacterium]
MTISLKDQRIAVIGGSSGVGLAVAELAAAAGANVTIAGRDQKKLHDAAAKIGKSVRAEVADAANAEAMRNIFSLVGPLDHLVLTLSGAKGAGPFRDLNLDELRQGFEAKFWPHVISAQAALPSLRKDGSITFISAISARMANPGTAGLAAINGAIEALVRPLAMELKPLRVNAVSPGVIDTAWWNRVPETQRTALFEQSAARTPAGRIGQSEDVAKAVLFLIEDTFMTGAVIECDGGLRLT